MAEAVGLAVGFIGLAGLFSSCVECFKLVQVYDSHSYDYKTLQTMLDNQQFHFMAWGKACGFMEPDEMVTNSRFDDPLSGSRNRRIEQTMERIQALLMNGDNLKEKYGLKVHRAPVGTKSIEGPTLGAFSKAFQSTKAFWSTSLQRKSQISGTIRWAVNDKDKFDKLIQNLRDLLADLSKFTDEIGVAYSQRLVIEYEIEMIDDEPSLELITAASACEDDDDLVSRAANRRLSRVKAQSLANQPVRFDDSVSMASLQRYTPSTSTLVEEEIEGVVQEVGITRVPLSQWRKVKTRAGIVPWLKVLVVATSSSHNLSEMRDDIQPISRSKTLSVDPEPFAHERAVRLAINSHTLIGVLKKISTYRFSSNHNVLVYPFKPLLLYENELRRYLVDAQEKYHRLMESQKTGTAVTVDSNDSKLVEGLIEESTASKIEKTKRIIQEMECLIDFIDDDMKELLRMRGQVAEKTLQYISFENLWLLFQPGIITVSTASNSNHELRAYQILHVTGGRPIIDVDNHSKSEGFDDLDSWDYDNQEGYAVISSRQCTDFVIDCFYMDFDGVAYGPRPQRFVISEFTGERDITFLPVYPPTRTELEHDLMKSLRNRGKRFAQFTGGGRYLYNELALKEWDFNHRDKCSVCAQSSNQEQVDSEVIIDHIMAQEQCRNSGCSWSVSFGGGVIKTATKANKREAFESVDCSLPNCKTCTDVFNDAVIDLNMRDRFIRSSRSLKALHQKQLDEDQFLLLPYRVCGYSLYHRRWHPLSVDLLQQVTVPASRLHELVIPLDVKSTLSALIKAQTRGTLRNDGDMIDLVRGKDTGYLILLHGAPGVGKTYTAEVLAAGLNKPLLWISVAGLGNTSREMEQNFTQFLKLAERWGCILLIREADALLAQRTRSDREGNNIISVFLDSLEYFSGIIILTTNRIGAFDEAIKGRIHIPLYFPRLDRDATRKLWQSNLRRLENQQRLVIDHKEILEFADQQYKVDGNRWNGRQIRNAVAIALALAQEEAEQSGRDVVQLRASHFKHVTKASQEFTEYVSSMQNVDHTEVARSMPLRMDQYQPKNQSRSDLPLKSEYRVSANRIESGSRTPVGAAALGSTQSDEDDLEVQELEIQLQMAKLKHRHKALKAKQIQGLRRQDASDESGGA